MQHSDPYTRNGILAGVFAFAMWGAFPIYFKVIGDVPSLEMLVHRIVWAVPFGALIIAARHQWRDVVDALRTPRTFGYLLLSAVFITGNWLIYIFAVQNEQIFQASLGYYINPLMLVLVGFLFLGERLRRMQTVAVLLATTGVLILTFSGGQLPWISLCLAVSFTIYGVIRKQVVVGAMPGLFIETLVLFPVAALYLGWLVASDNTPFVTSDPRMMGLLFLAGPLTVLPLLFFAIAARRLRLATIGFLQFIGPSGQFLVGYAYGEPLTTPHLICFMFIWSAVIVFVVDVWYSSRKAISAISIRPE